VSKDAIRILLLATAIAGVPILGTIFVTTATSEPDLAELVPINGRIANYVVLNWSELLWDPSSGARKATLGLSDVKCKRSDTCLMEIGPSAKASGSGNSSYYPKPELSYTLPTEFVTRSLQFTWKTAREFNSHPGC
jgi:hypothetical protein